MPVSGLPFPRKNFLDMDNLGYLALLAGLTPSMGHRAQILVLGGQVFKIQLKHFLGV